MRNFSILSMAMCLAIVCTAVKAETWEIAQQNKTFIKDGKQLESLEIKIGDTVNFVNRDNFTHNIYSQSQTPFDLGPFRNGETRSRQFNEAGAVEVECAIHPNMFLALKVTK